MQGKVNGELHDHNFFGSVSLLDELIVQINMAYLYCQCVGNENINSQIVRVSKACEQNGLRKTKVAI